MSKRFYQSGAQKRKVVKEREENISKLPKVTDFFSRSLQSQENNVQAASYSAITCEKVNANCEIELLTQSINVPSLLHRSTDQSIGQVNDLVTLKSTNKTGSLFNDADPSCTSIANVVEFDDNASCIASPALSNNITADTLHKYPALWPAKLNQNKLEREKYLNKGSEYFQNKNSNFETSKRVFKNQNRYFLAKYFHRELKNGEKYERIWLMFSPSLGVVFCFACKIFSDDQDNSFVKNGFSKWNKTDVLICSHENSKEHNYCMMLYLDYKLVSSRIDKKMIGMIETEAKYWTIILKRIVAVICFLDERGLPLRGKNEVLGSPYNGNYLGILELISEFDPILKQHIDTHAQKGRGKVSYLSKTICEEFINLMAKKVLEHIKSEIAQAKYWGLIVDSTPDISHVDQLSVVFRYYLDGHVYERFFCFLQIESHKGRDLKENILKLLKEHNIDIANCRAQTYDNAKNMSGQHKGLQACLKELNKLAFYVPCCGHSLNLVGECSVDDCTNAVLFFCILQGLYNFFTASTSRWATLNSKVSNLSATRWSCRRDATKDYVNNFENIFVALTKLSGDNEQKSDVRQEAIGLLKGVTKLENAFMAVFWNHILNRFNATSQYLQKVNIDLVSANAMLLSLVDFVSNLRNEFSKFETEAKALSNHISQEYSDSSKRQITKKLSNKETQIELLHGSEKFKIQTFYIIIDKLVSELKNRSGAYSHITDLFGFLTNLLSIDHAELELHAKKLIEIYSNDLSEDLLVELKQFLPRVKMQSRGFFSSHESYKETDSVICPIIILNWMVNNAMIPIFPNVYIAYRLLVTIPIANCESERSFSVLKRVKDLHRSTMRDERLSSLAILTIEKELLRSLSFDDLIDEFAKTKSRRKNI